jgi:hypothetical protein
MQAFRHAIHAAVCIIAFFPWLFGVVSFGCALALTILADKIWPNASWGNCWTYSGPRWHKHGGYVLIRPADGIRIPVIGSIPHAIWVPKLCECTVTRHTAPINRHSGKWFAWIYTVYFKFRVKDREHPHNSTWSDLQ